MFSSSTRLKLLAVWRTIVAGSGKKSVGIGRGSGGVLRAVWTGKGHWGGEMVLRAGNGCREGVLVAGGHQRPGNSV